LLAQTKVAKEKGTLCRGASHSLALLAKPGGCATRPNKPHKTRLVAELEQCSPKSPVLAALLGFCIQDFVDVCSMNNEVVQMKEDVCNSSIGFSHLV
jgi:hypothetical protein